MVNVPFDLEKYRDEAIARLLTSSWDPRNVDAVLRSQPSMTCVKIVTNLAWPAFRNVAIDIHKVVQPIVQSRVLDTREAESGGNILFVETIRKDTLVFLKRLLPGSNVVFYGTTEGHSILDEESRRVAKQLQIVAVSHFVEQMLEDVGVPVAGVVHHGLDMEARPVDPTFRASVEQQLQGHRVALTIASNDPRKGLDHLLHADKIVEQAVADSYQVLHSEPKSYSDDQGGSVCERYHDLPALVAQLGLERIWLTQRHGALTTAEVNALYQLCHVYVLSSFAEGFGLPMLEAFRFNKPVIAVDAPPFNEVIEDGHTGILIPCTETRWYTHKHKIRFKLHRYTPCALAHAMIDVLTNDSLRATMARNIHAEQRRWDIHRLYPNLLSFF